MYDMWSVTFSCWCQSEYFLANDQITLICLQLFSWGYNYENLNLGYSTDSHVNPTPKQIALSQGATTMHRFDMSRVVPVKVIFNFLTYMFWKLLLPILIIWQLSVPLIMTSISVNFKLY